MAKHFLPPEMTSEERKAYQKKIEDWEIAIGERFPKSEKLIETVSKGPIFRTDGFPEIATFEMRENTYSLIVAKDFGEAAGALENTTGIISAQVFSINCTDFLPKTGIWASNISFGFRFLGKTVPLILDAKTGRDRPKTFEEIVDTDELKLLAALRLDVDDLGFIFSRGMDGAWLGEIICLSREMQYFFSAHFDQLADKYLLYLIYSGGDDAFAVGKWDNVIAFSCELQSHFEDFTKTNQDVHFSAGIFMGNPHYPVGRFYGDAGELQDAAKNDSTVKNRVNIFNHIMTWKEYKGKISLGEDFFKALDGAKKDERKLNSAFIYRILNLVKYSFHDRTGFDRTGKPYHRGSLNVVRFSRNVAGLKYLFARHGMDEMQAKKTVDKIEKALIREFLVSFDFENLGQIDSIRDSLIALNYALLKKRAFPNSKS